LISNMNLTPAEQALFELWIESENGEMTNNKLSQKAPYITRFKPSTFTAIAIKLREKLQPVAEALGIPSDITFIGIQGIGFVAGREEEFSKLSQRERYAGFVDLIIDKTKYEVKRDYKKLDKSGWETVQVGNSTLHFTDIKIGRHNESSPTRGIAILKDFDHKEPIVAVLRHPQVISTLRALIQHHGYIDEFISASSGGSANVHKTIRQINEYFRPELGKDLIEMVGNDLRGYAIEGDFRARMKLIADWMHLEKLDLERLLMEMPTGKIAMQKVVPYFKDHSTTVELAESRDLSDIDTSLMILHTESMKRTLRLKKSFEEVADRPFTLIVETLLDKKRSDISRAKRIALEISEAEAVTLLIFRESSEINLVELGFSYKQREAIKKRFRKFLDRLDRLDVESQGGLCEDSILRLPKFIL